MENQPIYIMLKIRDEICLKPNELSDNFIFASREGYEFDASSFFKITNLPQTQEVEIKPDFIKLESIINDFGVKVQFLYNQIYENQLDREINNILQTIIDETNSLQASDKVPVNDIQKEWMERGILRVTNFYNYFYIEITDFDNSENLLNQLQQISISTENTFEEYVLDFTHFRYETEEAGGGGEGVVDANFQTFMGFEALRDNSLINDNRKKGEGITIVDCETAWKTGDKTTSTPVFLSTNDVNTPTSIQHGTKVSSVLMAAPSSGITAIAPAVSFIGSNEGSRNRLNLIENSILNGLIHFNRNPSLNGIILIEQEYAGYPVESLPSVFFILKLAYNLNITVIEPAGNGAFNLNKVILKTWTNPRSPLRTRLINISNLVGTLLSRSPTVDSILAMVDSQGKVNPYGMSGAIIVGAYGISSYGSVKNSGTAVTCYAQGEAVPSFTYIDGSYFSDGTTISVSAFAETSAASAIMAGFVAILKNIQINRTSPPSRALKPDEIREAIIAGKIAGTIGIPNIMQSVDYILSRTYAP